MKKEVSPGVIIGIAVVLVGIIAFAAVKVFGGDPAAKTVTPAQIEAVKQMRGAVQAPGVHRDENGHFVDANGNPVNTAGVKQ